MTADLLTLDDIAAMHHCSIRHARYAHLAAGRLADAVATIGKKRA